MDYSNSEYYTDSDSDSDNPLYADLNEDEKQHLKEFIDKRDNEINNDFFESEVDYYNRVYRVNNEPVNSNTLTETRDHWNNKKQKTENIGLTRLDTKLDVLIQMVQMNKSPQVKTDNKDFNVLKAYLKKQESSLLAKKRFFKQNSDTSNYKEIKTILKIIE